MIRKIVHIDEEKCNGCGLCVSACHESALQLVDGKAKLISDIYCDGLGDCLPACPVDAIQILERDADEYDQVAVDTKIAKEKSSLPCGCPGTQSRAIKKATLASPPVVKQQEVIAVPASQLMQWPCQIKLAPTNAPYFENADILIAADCTAFAYGNFHQEMMKGKITLIGCPKLDSPSYVEKLTAIFSTQSIKSVTVVRMEVPCCSGIVKAVEEALLNAKKIVPYQVSTITVDGNIQKN